MEHMAEWVKAGGYTGGLHNRQGLSQGDWESKVLALGTEGYQSREIEHILTGGQAVDQPIRDKWVLGSGTIPSGIKMIANELGMFYGISPKAQSRLST